MAKTIYNPQTIEPTWQSTWEKQQLFQDSANLSQSEKKREDKLYLLFAFAYPSGSGLHVGHVESKTALDILARHSRMQGKQVFFPVGWDAFGLPAENYAIKTGIHPAITTKDAITTFRRQIKRVGISYDWANELATNHPEYYRWTQWLFIQLFKAGLAYRKKGLVNWCPSCQTVLANEQVVNGECERCGSEVIQKELEQWFFRITAYRDELIEGLDQVDWPEATKQQQLNWIGKSEGAAVEFQVVKAKTEQELGTLSVYTTAHDTIYGVTFMVLAPEHELVKQLQPEIRNWSEVHNYIERSQAKTELQRQIQKDKTGVKLEGVEAVHPLTGAKVPVFVADYVLASYGSGAIMAVPAHDERDHEFAKNYGLSTDQVAQRKSEATQASESEKFISYTDIKAERENYELINSGEFSGLNYADGRAAILKELEKQGRGQTQNQYKLRDWLIARQRYWGAPIPMVYCEQCAQVGKGEQPDMPGWYAVSEDQLPVRLPELEDFKPTNDGKSPIEKADDTWKYTSCPGCGDTHAKREVDTMDTFVDSSWYYLRYTDSRNQEQLASPEQLKFWLPVDFYMIGPEHIVLHLLYSRFFTKFLRDQGYLNFDEPFLKMRHQGMILGPDNRKMSKSKGNVINPDEIIEKFGADTLRVYEMFMGPIEADKPWNDRAVAGVYRFLTRVYNLVSADGTAPSATGDAPQTDSVRRKLHQTIKKVSQDIPELKFNTAIAAMMEFMNVWETAQQETTPLTKSEKLSFIKILAPFAPFLAEELYHQITDARQEESVHQTEWPSFNPELVQEEELIIPVQINGKVREQLVLNRKVAEDKNRVLELAKTAENVQKWLAGKQIVKEIYVPKKIINLVVR